ncbi:hypothetical protein BJX76DRAFT_315560 [Aspergillus varians]
MRAWANFQRSLNSVLLGSTIIFGVFRVRGRAQGFNKKLRRNHRCQEYQICPPPSY